MREVNPSHPVALRPDTDYVFVVRGLSSNAAVRAEVHGSRSVARLPSSNGAFELRSHFKTGPKDFLARRHPASLSKANRLRGSVTCRCRKQAVDRNFFGKLT